MTNNRRDAAGNLTYDGGYRYRYDAWNRLVRVTKAHTQSQRFACLVLKALCKTDYDSITAHLHDNSTLGQDLHLHRVPHFTMRCGSTPRSPAW